MDVSPFGHSISMLFSYENDRCQRFEPPRVPVSCRVWIIWHSNRWTTDRNIREIYQMWVIILCSQHFTQTNTTELDALSVLWSSRIGMDWKNYFAHRTHPLFICNEYLFFLSMCECDISVCHWPLCTRHIITQPDMWAFICPPVWMMILANQSI